MAKDGSFPQVQFEVANYNEVLSDSNSTPGKDEGSEDEDDYVCKYPFSTLNHEMKNEDIKNNRYTDSNPLFGKHSLVSLRATTPGGTGGLSRGMSTSVPTAGTEERNKPRASIGYKALKRANKRVMQEAKGAQEG